MVILFIMEAALGMAALERALEDLGRLLAERGLAADLFVIGGAAMLLNDPHGSPPTRDVDAAARLSGLELVHPVLPDAIRVAIADVGRIHDIGAGWINAAAAQSFGNLVPPGALERATQRDFHALTIRIAARQDLISLKLAAATRRGNKGERHRQNLVGLRPSDGELEQAADWYLTSVTDPRAAQERLLEVVAAVRKERDGRS